MVFLGTIEPEIRSMVSEHVRAWGVDEVFIGCSGNFTLERLLAGRVSRLHGNDVSIYTCTLGKFLATGTADLRLRESSRAELSWLEPFLDDGAGSIATMLLCTNFLIQVGRTGRYAERMVAGYRDQFPSLHERTRAKVEAIAERLRLTSFSPIDVVEFLAERKPDDAVVSFPPFTYSGQGGGYEAMWRPLETHFEWLPPAYSVLDEDGVTEVLHRITDRRRWLFASNIRHPDLEDHLIGSVRTSMRRVANWVYASESGARLVRPVTVTEPVKAPRLGPGDQLGERLAIAPLRVGQFNALRAAYLNPGIRPADPMVSYAVTVDGVVIGAFGYNVEQWNRANLYLLSDFVVSPTEYPRLSKLVVMAAISRETQQLMQNALSRRLDGWSTTIFTNKPVSMKMRGVGVLSKRSDCPEPAFRYQLQYGGILGERTLAESYAHWRAKWAS